jgi:hypothetical protein
MSRPSICFHTFIVIALLVGCPAIQAPAEERLAYYSDYFSFIGADDRGRVAFALDTNRGQDGVEFQAEHFVALHDEKNGWQKLQGNGSFANPAGKLLSIPNSVHFHFQGLPDTGMVIESQANRLILKIEPILTVINRNHLNDRYRMGSSSATLEWRGRSLEGRVIYEYVHFDNWNRLTRTYVGFWKNFHGIYLMTINPVTKAPGDLYLHSQQSNKRKSLVGLVDGFAVIDGNTLHLSETKIRVTSKRLALGLYLWPHSWSGHWQNKANSQRIEFNLRLTKRKTFGNWVIGGFAMGIVKGVVSHQGRALDAYGLGEIIK